MSYDDFDKSSHAYTGDNTEWGKVMLNKLHAVGIGAVYAVIHGSGDSERPSIELMLRTRRYPLTLCDGDYS